jgi:predicted flap endonuclease-1-like 5' DNA nuclease
VEAVPAAADPTPAAEVEAVPDDLTRIEGIGPYYRDALHKLGITSFAQLAAYTDAEALVNLLKSNGYRQHPSIPTWAEQAALAAAGDWEALAALQATLSGGRRSGD